MHTHLQFSAVCLFRCSRPSTRRDRRLPALIQFTTLLNSETGVWRNDFSKWKEVIPRWANVRLPSHLVSFRTFQFDPNQTYRCETSCRPRFNSWSPSKDVFSVWIKLNHGSVRLDGLDYIWSYFSMKPPSSVFQTRILRIKKPSRISVDKIFSFPAKLLLWRVSYLHGPHTVLHM